MLYDIGVIQRDVRVALDQNANSAPLVELGDIDTLSINEIISGKIVESAIAVERVAPFHLLGTGKAFADSIYWEGEIGKGWGVVLLPDDFFRLLSFQMSDWETAVYNPITPSEPLYKLQSSRIPGIRGTPQKPVCAIVPAPVGLTLEFYSCTGGETVKVERAQYLPRPVLTENGIDIPEWCYNSVINYCAGMVCAAYGSKEQAELLYKQSSDLLL